MPFGIRKPFKYVKSGRTLIQPENYDRCPVCSKFLTTDSRGYVPVAPCLIPLNDNIEHDLIVVLACASCYRVQNKLAFVTIEELRDYRATKKGRGVSNPTTKLVKAPKTPKAQKTSDVVHRSTDHDDFLVSLYLQVRNELVLKGYNIDSLSRPLEVIGRCDSEESDLSRRNNSQGLPDYDIEFGMTEEQRQRMDKAVHDAAERTKLVPSEAWNGKTSAEILKLDKNGLPDGW